MKQMNISPSEGIRMVCLGWVFICVLGAMPYYLSGYLPRLADAVFESVSGFTTTGATVILDLEVIPRPLHFWRAMTHWLGGMGIVVLTVALVPLLGVGGFQLLKAETTGPNKGKFTPKVTATAKILWLLYLGFTALQTVLLVVGGMSWFDAIIHAFSTMATGGFSTRNASIAAYHSAYIEWVCTVFMLIASFNFTLIYRLFQGKYQDILKNSEAKAYGIIVVAAALLITASGLPGSAAPLPLADSLRQAFFHVASIITTTGFMADDINRWPALAQGVLLLLMFIGGCSGSTAGGVKVIRYVILAKQMKNEIRKLVYPSGVFSIHLDKAVGRHDVVYGVAGFMGLYFMLLFATVLLICSAEIGLFDALNGALITLGNIGLGLGHFSSGAVFYTMPGYVKWGLSVIMIAGRLELWTVLVFIRQCCLRP
jgi:trk system potassium uptake protein TrkH